MTTAKKQETVSLSQIQPGGAKAQESRQNLLPPEEEIDSSAAQNIDQIRNILFGREMTQYEKRFNQIEARLIERTQQVKDEMRKRLDNIESLIRKEIDSLAHQLKNEKDQRTQQGMDLSGELKATAAALTQSVNQLQNELRQAADAHHNQLLDQVKELNEKITSTNDDTMAAVKKSTLKLQTDKVDRSALSDLLIHLAGKLSPSAPKTKLDHE